MPLEIKVKPGEKVLVGQAVLSNTGNHTARLSVHNQVPVVREKDVLFPEDAEGFWDLLYVVVLHMYADHQTDETAWHKPYFNLLRYGLTHYPEARPTLMEIANHLVAGDFYRALRICTQAMEAEKRGESVPQVETDLQSGGRTNHDGD